MQRRPAIAFVPMSQPQRRYLYRLLAEAGVNVEDMATELCSRANIDNVDQLSRSMASALIDELKTELGHEG